MASIWDGLAIVAVIGAGLFLYSRGYLQNIVGTPPAWAAGNGTGTPGCPAPCNCIYDNASQTCLCSGTNNCPCTGCSTPKAAKTSTSKSSSSSNFVPGRISPQAFDISAGQEAGKTTTGTPTAKAGCKCVNHICQGGSTAGEFC